MFRVLICLCSLMWIASCEQADSHRKSSVLDGVSIIRWDIPKSNSSDLKLPYRIPATSYNIYYAELVSGMQEYHSFLRFNFDPSEEPKLIDLLRAQSELRTGKSSGFTSQPLAENMPTIPKELMPLEWWDIGAVKNGACYSQIESHGLQVFIDQDKSIAYIYSSD